MKNTVLSYLWGGLALLCALLGLIPQPIAALEIIMRLLGLLFFLPPFLLLLNGRRADNQTLLKRLRFLSLLSLVLSVGLLIANIPGAFGPEWLAGVLEVLFALLSVPAMCCGSYALSLFLWVCLLLASLSKKKPQMEH